MPLPGHASHAHDEDEGVVKGHRGHGRRLALTLAVIALAIVVGAALLNAGSGSQQPSQSNGIQISLTRAEVVAASSSSVTLLVQVSVHNPLHNTLTFYGALYTLSADGDTVYNGYMRPPTQLPPGATRLINTTISIDPTDTGVNLSNGEANAAWVLSGNADLGTPSGNQTASFFLNFKT